MPDPLPPVEDSEIERLFKGKMQTGDTMSNPASSNPQRPAPQIQIEEKPRPVSGGHPAAPIRPEEVDDLFGNNDSDSGAGPIPEPPAEATLRKTRTWG